MDKKCHHSNCNNECIPELIVCLDHAHKDTLWMLIQQLCNEKKDLEKQISRLENEVDDARYGNDSYS